MQRRVLCRSRRELSDEYFLAKFGSKIHFQMTKKLVSIQLKTSTETSKYDFRITQRFNFPMVVTTSPRQGEGEEERISRYLQLLIEEANECK